MVYLLLLTSLIIYSTKLYVLVYLFQIIITYFISAKQNKTSVGEKYFKTIHFVSKLLAKTIILTYIKICIELFSIENNANTIIFNL